MDCTATTTANPNTQPTPTAVRGAVRLTVRDLLVAPFCGARLSLLERRFEADTWDDWDSREIMSES